MSDADVPDSFSPGFEWIQGETMGHLDRMEEEQESIKGR